MTDTATGNDWGIALQLGSDWFDLSIGDEPDVAGLEAQVDARIGRETRLLESRQKLIDMLIYFSRDASRRGLVRAAMRWALDELDGVSVATLYMTSYIDNLVGDIDQLLELLQARLTPRHGNDRVDPAVEVRDLPAGRAIRVDVMTDSETRWDDAIDSDDEASGERQRRSVVLETVQYWFPVPGQNVVTTFTFSTPNLAGAAALVDEFDQILEGLRVT